MAIRDLIGNVTVATGSVIPISTSEVLVKSIYIQSSYDNRRVVFVYDTAGVNVLREIIPGECFEFPVANAAQLQFKAEENDKILWSGIIA